ncbi:MAG: tryptophan 7-halogenase [Anaerolineae bacterium]|nr:tryptophan 7-halogenase [Anaerolineae bacterium]
MQGQTPHRIENIVIVGGGTAGWLAAAYLNQALNRGAQPACRITLVESSDIPTIGVGEATIPTLLNTFQFLDISESDWMVKCGATFKLGIKFVNWLDGSTGDEFWHPFGLAPVTANTSIPLSHFWLKKRLKGQGEPFATSCSAAVRLCKNKKSPRFSSDPPYIGHADYAYHLDAGRLAAYLKERTKARGISHVVDHVLDVRLDEQRFIRQLITANHGPIEGDLFIDCSGFRGLLINQALGEPFTSYADSLLCDRAVAVSMPYSHDDPYDEKRGGINPYTTATALGSGWAWHTPLVGRSGNGYVYAGSFISPEEAEKEFKQYLGEKAVGIEAKHLTMRVGKTQRSWVSNCVSIGLAGGFIEPLESTGIYLIEAGLKNLVRNFPDKRFQPATINAYNHLMTRQYEEIRDFIVMHYCLTQRDDTPFWQANKADLALPQSLQHKLEQWYVMWPNNPLRVDEVFTDFNHMCILAGMNRLPQQSLPILDYYDDNEADLLFSKVRTRAKILQKRLPAHSDDLKRLRLKTLLATSTNWFAQQASA